MKNTDDNQVRDLFTLLDQTCGPINYTAVLPNVEEGQFSGIDTFVQDANSVSQAIHDEKEPGARIIFKHTNHVHAPGHISDTKALARPHIAAAHEKYWFNASSGLDKQDAVKDHVWWPFVSLAANRRSEGKESEKEALDSLDLLLLSRPDVLGAFGLLIDEECVVLYFAIGGFGFDNFSFRWGTFSLRTAMATMIYTLYHPWTNPSISLMDSFDFRKGPATYEITFSAAIAFNEDEPPTEDEDEPPTEVAEDGIPNGQHSIECPGFIVRAAHSTAGTRTHVFVFDTAHAVSECPRLSGRELRVIKSQLVKEKDGLKFEPDFFRLIHGSQRAPGVIPMTCYEYRPRVFPDGRRKRHVLLAMEVEGRKFSQIMKPRDILLASYNTLESKKHFLSAHA
ncbi:hypothetical protein ONZ45_g16502 [Pleurotus djamor]|nr:hypothetical protein ONZ45_g16502 [Pleurotus djamor]